MHDASIACLLSDTVPVGHRHPSGPGRHQHCSVRQCCLANPKHQAWPACAAPHALSGRCTFQPACGSARCVQGGKRHSPGCGAHAAVPAAASSQTCVGGAATDQHRSASPPGGLLPSPFCAKLAWCRRVRMHSAQPCLGIVQQTAPLATMMYV